MTIDQFKYFIQEKSCIYLSKIICFLFLIYLASISLKIALASMPLYPNIDETLSSEISYYQFAKDSNGVIDFSYPGLTAYFGKFLLNFASFFGFAVGQTNLNLESLLNLGTPASNTQNVYSIIRIGFVFANWVSLYFLYKTLRKFHSFYFSYTITAFLIGSQYYHKYFFYSGPDFLSFTIGVLLLAILLRLVHLPSNSDYHMRYVILASVLVGMAISAKYQAVMTFGLLFSLLLVKYKLRKLHFFLITLVVVPLVFILCNPTILKPGNFTIFLSNMNTTVDRYSNPSPGIDSDFTFFYYIRAFMDSSFSIVGLGFFFIALLYFVFKKQWSLVLLLFFPFAILLPLSLYDVALARNISIAIPFYVFGSVLGLDWIVSKSHLIQKPRVLTPLVLSFVVIFIAGNAVKYDSYAKYTDSRVAASDWVRYNIESTATIYMSNGSKVDHPIMPRDYRVLTLADTATLRSGDYLIESSFMYSPIYRVSDCFMCTRYFRYPAQIQEHKSRLQELILVKSFQSDNVGDGNEIVFESYGREIHKKIFIHGESLYSGPSIRIYRKK